ncbi:insulinase family protein, partial [Thermodesulfobacteriota bacterium]
PEQTDMVTNEVRRIAADLALNGVTQDELSRAIKPILTGIKDMRQTNDYWLNSVLTGSTDHPVQLDWSRTIMKDYASITAQEISKFAETYLNNRKAAVFVVKPAG